MILNTILHLLPLISGVYAVCEFSPDTAAPIRHLTDLRTATPFTYTDTYSESGCAATPTTATIYYTLNVAGTTYPALDPKTYTLHNAKTTGLATWVFPGLTITQFTPGERATVTWSIVHGATAVSASFFFVVPSSITLTAQPTLAKSTSTILPQTSTALSSQTSTTLSSTSTQTTTTPTVTNSAVPQTSTSTPVGAIVGGIIAGLVLITAILAFTWYKVSTRQQMLVLHEEPFNYETGKSLIPGDRAVNTGLFRTEEYEMGGQTESRRAVPIRYPDFSANLEGDY